MSFFNDLLGKSSANAATQLGQRNAAQLNQSYGQANDYSKQGYDASTARYQPYAEGGQKGYQAYSDAIGLNGHGAQQGQFQNFQSDPFQTYAAQNTGNQLNSLFKRYNGQGMGNSGASQLAVARMSGENARTDVNNWLQRLQGMGQQGLQVAGAQAGLDQGYYGGMSDRSVGLGNALTNNDTQATMAANNARQSGINNLLGIFGTVAGAGARMYNPTGYGSGAGGGKGGMP